MLEAANNCTIGGASVSKNERRKAALAAFRARKPRIRIYAIHCAATQEQWIGRSTDLEAVRKRIFFTLAQRANPHRRLQEAWNSFGTEALDFEEVEVLADELSEGSKDLWLRSKLKHWLAQRGGKRI